MGYSDAKKDGVRVIRTHAGTLYYPRCFFCRKELERHSYMSKCRYVCTACAPLKRTFRDYFQDRGARSLDEAIARERERKESGTTV